MTVPGPVEGRAIARELVETWYANDLAPITMGRRENERIGMVVYSLYGHAIACADAALTLYDQNLAPASIALIREVVEMAYTAGWVELYGDSAARALMHEETRNQVTTLKAFMAAGMAPDDEAVETVKATLSDLESAASPPGRTFQARCEDIAGGDTIYALYRILSRFSHAGTATTGFYLHEREKTPDAPLGLAASVRPIDDGTDTWFNLVPVMLIHGGLAWARIDKSHGGRTRLKELARLYQIGTKAQATAVGMRRARERDVAARKARRAAGGAVVALAETPAG